MRRVSISQSVGVRRHSIEVTRRQVQSTHSPANRQSLANHPLLPPFVPMSRHYWAAGTGYGHSGAGGDKWDVEAFLAAQEEQDRLKKDLLQVPPPFRFCAML